MKKYIFLFSSFLIVGFIFLILVPLSFSYTWSAETINTLNVGASGSPNLLGLALDNTGGNLFIKKT